MHDLTITMRGQLVTIKNVSLAGADRSAGIISDYVDEYTLHDANGTELEWYDSMTEDEVEAIDRVIYDQLHRSDIVR